MDATTNIYYYNTTSCVCVKLKIEWFRHCSSGEIDGCSFFLLFLAAPISNGYLRPVLTLTFLCPPVPFVHPNRFVPFVRPAWWALACAINQRRRETQRIRDRKARERRRQANSDANDGATTMSGADNVVNLVNSVFLTLTLHARASNTRASWNQKRNLIYITRRRLRMCAQVWRQITTRDRCDQVEATERVVVGVG